MDSTSADPWLRYVRRVINPHGSSVYKIHSATIPCIGKSRLDPIGLLMFAGELLSGHRHVRYEQPCHLSAFPIPDNKRKGHGRNSRCTP